MGTRSVIGVMHGDVCKSVYCHWDGYLDHNGKILAQHYNSAKANNLVALGDLSSLRERIAPDENEQHSFEHALNDVCVFYGRDRGEEDVSWAVTHTFAEFLDRVDRCGAEYYYIMKDGVWYAGAVYDTPGLERNNLIPLTTALDQLSSLEDA